MKRRLRHMMALLLTVTCIGMSAQIPTSDLMISPQTNEIIPPSPSSAQQMRYQSPQPSLATGAVNLTIPVYTLEVEGVSIPFTMTYHTSGIKPLDDPFPCGYGWSLQPALRVTRTVRGRPDEQFHYVGDSIAGGLHFTDKRVAFACMVSNSPNHSSTIRERYDAEKDIFSISLPTTALTRIVQKNQDGTFSFIGGGADDEYTISGTGSKLEEITVTDPYGVRYIFGGEYMSDYVECPELAYPDVTAMITSWGIKEIILPSGRKIAFDWELFSPHDKYISGGDAIGDMFNPSEPRYSPQEIKILARGSVKINPRGNYARRLRLSSVTFPGGKVSLIYGDYVLETFKVSAGNDIVRQVDFAYSHYKYDLYFLKELTLSGEGTYSFEYNPFNVENKLPLTSSVLYNIDWWGYYNGRTPKNGKGYTSLSPQIRLKTILERSRDGYRYEDIGESDRRPDADSMQAGILRKIIYPTGGLSTFDYEPHRFPATKVDSHGNIDAQTDPSLDFGGGLRVKKITTYAGASDTTPHIRTYQYDSVVVTAVPSAATFISVVDNAVGLYSDPNLYIQPHTYRMTTVRHESDYMNNHIGEEAIWYNKVTEIYPEGKIEYIFNQTNPTSTEERYWGKLFPKELNNVFSNGLRLKEKRIFKSDGASYRKIETDRFDYETTGGNKVLNSFYIRDYIQAAVDASEAPDFWNAERFDYYSDINEEHPAFFLLSNLINVDSPYIGCPYSINLISDRLRSKTVTQHFDNGDFTQTETYTYKPGTSIITSVSTSTPGDTRTNRIDLEYAVMGRNSAETAMVRANIIGFPVKTTLTFGTATTAVRREMQSYGNRVFRPVREWMSRGATEWRVGQYDYDAFGNVREFRGTDSVPSVYLWGYEGRHPVYRIDGASFAEVNAKNPGVFALNGTAERTLLTSLLSDWLVTKSLWRPMVGITSMCQPSGITSTYTYDNAGRLIKTAISGHGTVESYSYHINEDGRNYTSRTVFTSADGTGDLSREVINYDGLGRETSRLRRAPETGRIDPPAQAQTAAIQTKMPPNYNAVMTEYDAMDRPCRQWSVTGVQFTNPTLSDLSSAAAAHYGTDYAYCTTFYEPSPRGVVASTRKAGTEWHDADRRVTTRILTNTASGDYVCYEYSTQSESSSYVRSQRPYPAGTLTIEETVDEEGHTSLVFKDVRGLVVMTREGKKGDWHDTRYAYNDYGDLRWVIQPKHPLVGNILKERCFRYDYDSRGRCTLKALPECEGTRYWYDSRGRLFAEQDGNMKADGRFLLHFYDRFGREAFCSFAATTEDKINSLLNSSHTVSPPVKGAYLRSPTGGYRLTGFTLSLNELVSATYYDNYDFSYDLSGQWDDYKPAAGYPSPRTNLKGMVTGSLAGNYVSVLHYDAAGRPIRTASGSLMDIPQSISAQRLDYEGNVTEELREDRTGTKTVTQRTVRDYSPSGFPRSVTVYQGNDTARTIYGYDDAGRVAEITFASDIHRTQTYNANGWLTDLTVTAPANYTQPERPVLPGIQSADATGGFIMGDAIVLSEKLHYADAGSSYTSRYDGKIAGREHGSTVTAYSYDCHGRLTETKDNMVTSYTCTYTYDKNSNIVGITRKGIVDYTRLSLRPGPASGTLLPIHGNHNTIMLGYSPYGNRLRSADVTREGADYEGRTGLAETDGTVKGFAYDANGNLTKDPARDIVLIKYNHLNLPTDVYFGNGQRQTIEYHGNGVKKAVRYYQTTAAIVGGNVPDDDSYTLSSTRTYVGPHIYTDEKLEYSAFAGGYFDPAKGAMYYLTDWQGNNAAVVDKSGTVVQSTTYYPYGEPTVEPTGQRFLYGGKEREHAGGRNSYDFSARCLISPIGQWGVPDRKAEKYFSYSPYSYCGGDPINYIDDDGEEVLCLRKNSKAAKNFPDNGNLIILAHGDFNGIYDEFSDKYITSGSDFISLVREKTYNFKDLEASNKFACIELLSCHSGENPPNASTPFAQKLSGSLKNVVIKAPNGVLNIGINTKKMRVQLSSNGVEDTDNKIKYWRYFYNGTEITDIAACFIQMLISMELFLNDNIDKFINLFDEIHNPKD